MQTIKTSSIVVLLMTVMYGGYVSLTTPPEPIPPEVADLLKFEDDLGIDTGIAVAGDSFAPGANPPAISIATAPDQSPSGSISPGQFDMPITPRLPAGNDPAPTNSGGTLSLGSPQGGPAPASDPNGFQAQNAPQNTAPSLGNAPTFSGLPRVSTPATTVSVDLNTPFPSTSGSFQMPTPGNAQDNFDPQTGRSFNPPSANGAGSSMPSADMDLGVIDLDQPQTKLTEQVSLNMDAGTAANQISLANQPPSLPKGNAPTGDNIGLTNAFKTADRQYSSDQLREALATLSVFYGTPNLPVTQRAALLTRLDPLAREVIYSPRHLLETPHRVGSNETLMEIAQSYSVPWQLLANINGIKDPLVITPGTELKVVRGPFNARVDLAKRELTIFLGDLYAGRFPVAVGSDPAPQAGTFTVQDKQSLRTFYDRSGAPIAAGDPANPYGKVWIDLGNRLCIHGSPEAKSPNTNGCISLAADYADDLFGILSQGSSVTIRR